MKLARQYMWVVCTHGRHYRWRSHFKRPRVLPCGKCVIVGDLPVKQSQGDRYAVYQFR